MANKLNINLESKIRIQWNDKPENYSRENKIKIRNDFAKKHGADKNNIQVIFTPVKIGANGDMIEISGGSVDNIMDPNYQRELFKEWLKRENIEIDLTRLLKLDDLINGEMDGDYEPTLYNKWELKWLKINNFLSYGEDTKLNFNELNGFNIVSSIPENTGGKTVLTIDSLKFLFFGRTTKTDKNEEIFNTYTDTNTLSVKGLLNLGDGNSTIIERKLTRSPKKGGGWNIKSFLNFYRILPDGEEEMLSEEDSKVTTKEIKKMVGSESDFDITVLTTGRNLEDLIDSTPTENGKLLNKFIGLEVIEVKEQIARKKSNEFSAKKIANLRNPMVLMDDITNNEESKEMYDGLLIDQEENLVNLRAINIKLEESKESLLINKMNIDVSVLQMNLDKIEKELADITASGIKTSGKIKELVTEIALLVEADYNEERYIDNFNGKLTLESEFKTLENKVSDLDKLIIALQTGELCPTCNRKLEDVDHTNEIDIHVKESHYISSVSLPKISEDILKHKDIIAGLIEDKEKVDKRNLFEIQKDKLEIEKQSLQNNFKIKKGDLKKYRDNEEAINFNKNIDSELEMVKTNIIVGNTKIESVLTKIVNIKNIIKTSENVIANNTLLLTKIQKESEIEKLYKTYIDMVGKKGVGKLVLRSVLPIINSELSRLLEDVCDFEIELIINSKNEVEYLLKRDDVIKNLRSGSGFERTMASLALRCVLSRVSHLPSPNFITFDEVLGKVSPVNYGEVKLFFNKIAGMFDSVFLIIHNEILTDWGDRQIIIKKVNNISKIVST